MLEESDQVSRTGEALVMNREEGFVPTSQVAGCDHCYYTP